MCIPHGMTTASSSGGFVKVDKRDKQHIEKPSKRMFEKGDPSFVDERTKPYTPKKQEGFFSSLFK